MEEALNLSSDRLLDDDDDGRKFTDAHNFSHIFNSNKLLKSNERQCLYLNHVIKQKNEPFFVYFINPWHLSETELRSVSLVHAVFSQLATPYKLNHKRA